MIESLLVITIIGGLLFLVKGIDDGRMAYSWIAVLLFIVTMANSLYIEIPETGLSYTDYVLPTICAALIFVCILHIVAMMFEEKMSRKYRL